MNREIIRRRLLPHWDVPNAPYFVTSCLFGSMPTAGLTEMARFRKELGQRPQPPDKTEEAWHCHCWKLAFARLDYWLDEKPARRDVAAPALAQVVVQLYFHFAEERYDLYAYVVMPSHTHWLFRPLAQWEETLPEGPRTPRERIVYSTNRFTARECNRLRNARGGFWQWESYDHWVRDADEMERIIRYIEENPVKAGLVRTPEEWRFSSAWVRKASGAEWGAPLVKRMVELYGVE